MRHPRRLDLPETPDEPPRPDGSVFFVGTATMILRLGGLTILTDPNFLHRGDHVHLGYGLTAERRTDPAIAFEDLPRVDLVLLSHLHEDHFDRLVQERLDRSLPIVTTPAAARALAGLGFRSAQALETWETMTVAKGATELRITAMPGKHGPGPMAWVLPPVMGSLLEVDRPGGGPPFRTYITGDTIRYAGLEEITRRYPEIDLVFLHLGGTRVLGVTVTMDARQGIEVVRLIGPRLTVPIHYDDYSRFMSPLEDFVREVRDAGKMNEVYFIARGETLEFGLEREALSGALRRAAGPT